MTCNICQDDYGFTFGCDCSFLMCDKCAQRNYDSNGDKCPHCSKSLRINTFFSGKIMEISEYDIYSPPENYKLIVYDDDKINKENFYENITHDKMGRSTIDKNKLIKLSDFSNLNEKLPIKEYDKFIYTCGPCVLINPQGGMSHGQWYDDCLMNTSDYKNVINERNTEMIMSCDVFTLTINDDNDCFCSYGEWGQALHLNKVLVLNVNKNNEQLKEYHMFAIQSLKSFEELLHTKREFIIRYNPTINFEDFKSYKEYMNYIIGLK